ncbi:DgyrCDS4149 [Dimorphilus gyrociliatus]|uniref:DgyrCDS4149 n=1 Tax=Dimorphilus gyrociliatus TaxID=2664684 RepID=A0A7I8VGL4_9ANNE|nr:DgyrCDS4149 [Dimorphilus gyrociliatus]
MSQWQCLKTFEPSPNMWACLTWVKPAKMDFQKTDHWSKLKTKSRSTFSSPTSKKRNPLRTSYNERARQGFKYWPMDRPKPTSFGKYGTGSYKTVLGLGNAPRT